MHITQRETLSEWVWGTEWQVKNVLADELGHISHSLISVLEVIIIRRY